MIKLDIAYRTELNMSAEFSGSWWAPYNFLAFSGGRAIMLCGNASTDCWLVEIDKGRVDKRLLPAMLSEELLTYADCELDLAALNDIDWRLRLFKFGDMIGLLLADRKVYLLRTIHDDLIAIPIENRLAKWSSEFERGESDGTHGRRSFIAQVFGYSTDHRIPVLFTSEQFTLNYIALLSINLTTRTAKWHMRQPPALIPYRNHATTTGYTCFSHAAWIGNSGLVYVVGNTRPHPILGMEFSALVRIDENAQVLETLLELQEPCYGYLVADLDKLLITPMHKNKERKGKQTFIDLTTWTESTISLPKGCAKLKVIDCFDGHVWLANVPLDRAYDSNSEESATFVSSRF